MSGPLKIGASAWSYGGTFNTAGVELSQNRNGINNTLYAGFGTNTGENGTQVGGVFDYRANAPVGNVGGVNVSTGVRVRTKVIGDTFNTETRGQLNFGGNIYGNFGWYGTAYARQTVDWHDGSTKETFGEFAGVSYKGNGWKLSAEQQLDNKNGLSVNVGGSVDLGSVGRREPQVPQNDVPVLISYDD